MALSSAHDPPGSEPSDDLRGLEILLVEDSKSVGEAIKSLLLSLGADVAGPAATTAEAERLMSEYAPDVALVDFHLRGGELSYSLIARLRDRGIPVILTSASEIDPPPRISTVTILEKPFSETRLLATLRPLIAQNRRTNGTTT
jgi:CheY-like chemotaxis protein